MEFEEPLGGVGAVDTGGLVDKCRNWKVRRERNDYLPNVPKPKLLLGRAEKQRSFGGPVLIVWARDDKLMPLPLRAPLGRLGPQRFLASGPT